VAATGEGAGGAGAMTSTQDSRAYKVPSAILVRANRLIGIIGFVVLPILVLRGSNLFGFCTRAWLLNHFYVFSSMVESKILSDQALCFYELICGSSLVLRLIYIGVFREYIIRSNVERFERKGRIPKESFKTAIFLYLLVVAPASLIPFASLSTFDHAPALKLGMFALALWFLFLFVTPEIVLYSWVVFFDKNVDPKK
jgi:hypothetical protein